MGVDFLAVFSHGIRHSLQHVGVLAGVHCGHAGVLDEREFLYCQGLVQVLLLNVLLDVLVADWVHFVVQGTEEHSRGVVVLIVDNIHSVVPDILLLELLLATFFGRM